MGRTLQIETPRAFLPLLKPARYKGLWGGRGSAKSHTFAEMMIEEHLNPGERSVCIREVQRSLSESVKRLLEDKIATFSLGKTFRVMNTHIETPGDGIITFQGMQNHTAESIKSLEGYRRAWVEEAQSLSKRSLMLLRPTIRTEYCRYCRLDQIKCKTRRCIDTRGHLLDPPELWFSWNPSKADDPVDELLRGTNKPPDAIVIGTTYRDNPWFPDVLQKEMEWDRLKDPEKYAHVWLGEYERHSESRVFKNFRILPFESPRDGIYFTGADWGFSVDPSSLVRCREERIDPSSGQPWPRKRLYIDYECYAIGVEIDDLPLLFDGLVCGCKPRQPQPCADPTQHAMARTLAIVADSARPETISYLRRHGYPRIDKAKKGANSVKEGVIFLQGYDIIIHPRCIHAIDEFTMYSYVVEPKTGLVTNVLQDKKNHIIDPTRYATEQLRGALQIRKAVWG